MPKKTPIVDHLEGKPFKPLKQEIKWTRRRIILLSLLVAIPYIGMVILASSISQVLAGLLIGFPVAAFALMYLMHSLTKDL